MNLLENTNITYQIKGEKTFLVVEFAGSQSLIAYHARMIELNTISGLLPAAYQSIDGNSKLIYDISDKTKLKDLAKRSSISNKHAQKIICNYVSAMLSLGDYSLCVPNCVMDLDYLFIDENFNIFLPYMPIELDTYEDVNKLSSQFLLSIIGNCFASKNNSAFFDPMLKMLLTDSYSLTKLRRKLEPAPEAAKEYKPVQFESDCAQPAAVVSSSSKKVSSQKTEKPPVQNSSFKVPAGPANLPQKKETSSKNAKSAGSGKKSLFSFGTKKPKPSENENSKMTQAPIHDASASSNSKAFMATEQWEGTIAMEEDEATVMEDGIKSHMAASLVHNGKRTLINQFPFAIGKTSSDFKIDKPTVSRNHATILSENGAYYIRDENSKNHTYINHKIIPPYTLVPLENASQIEIGCEVLEFFIG